MKKQKQKNIFIAPLNWGLGHATRVLPIIKICLSKGFNVFIAAHGRSLELLKREVPSCKFVDFPEYPIRYPRSRFFITRFMLITFPLMLNTIRKERRALDKLHQKYNFDYIISDNRFRTNLPGVVSFLISHQLRYKLPLLIKKFEWLPEYFNYFFFKNYTKIIIPDYKGSPSFTAELSHNLRYLPAEKLYYAGIITDINKTRWSMEKDIDYLVIISGPEPQRSKFEEIIFRQIDALKGKVVIALGRPEDNYKIRRGNATFFTYLNREQIMKFMDRSAFIISRPGYTTVMEMSQMGKKGMFIPTPGQIEQEYLAAYFRRCGWCYSVSQFKLNLAVDLNTAKQYPGFPEGFNHAQSNVRQLVDKLLI